MIRTSLVGWAFTLALLAAPAAHAQVTVDVSKITCEQFLLFKVTDPDYIALWLSGYYHGKAGSTIVDTQEFKENIAKLKEYCRANMQQPIMQAVESRLRVK